MKALVVSDNIDRLLHSSYIKKKVPNIDVIISCGDLPAYYLDFLVSNLNKPLLYVCGNHDYYGLRRKKTSLREETMMALNYRYNDRNRNDAHFGGTNMDLKTKELGDLVFSGIEGSINYNNGVHQFTESQMKHRLRKLDTQFFWRKLRKKNGPDVVITHSPPRGIHDLEDPPHKGFESFIPFIEKYQPSYFLHGHIHLYDINAQRITEYGNTKIINCYNYLILDLEID